MILENESLRIFVKEEGGNLGSIYDKEREEELLYQPHSDSWKGQDVFIFPFIARLKEGTYTYKGKEYALKNHGLIRYMKGKETKEREEQGFISFESNEETFTQFPFEFKAKAIYKLSEKIVSIQYVIENRGKEVMPFMVGAHPAFKLPGTKNDKEFDISGNKIQFDKKKVLRQFTFEETGSFITGEKEFMETDEIELSHSLFRKEKTVLLNANNFSDVTLIKKDNSKIIVHKHNLPYCAIWSDSNWGDYVAIEPWDGYPDWLDCDKEILNKKGIRVLNPNESYTFQYEIEID